MNRNGMTIMELMIAMALSAIAFSLIWGVYSFYTRSISSFSLRRDKHRDMIFAVDHISEELRCAQEVLQIEPDSCYFISSLGDTMLYYNQNDTLFRLKGNDSLPQFFKQLDSLQFQLPDEVDSSDNWRQVTILGAIFRGRERWERYHRSVTISYTPHIDIF